MSFVNSVSLNALAWKLLSWRWSEPMNPWLMGGSQSLEQL
jgi:hypothetical protein